MGLVIVGTATGVFQPVIERIGAKGDELLIKLNTEKDIEANEDYFCYSTVKMIKDQEVNWTICEDGEYFNATEGINGLVIEGKKVVKLFYGKKEIKYYLEKDAIEYRELNSNLENLWQKIRENRDLLNILYLRNNLTEKGIDKIDFGDYKDLDDYYFFSNNCSLNKDKLLYLNTNVLFESKCVIAIPNINGNIEDSVKDLIINNEVFQTYFQFVDLNSNSREICEEVNRDVNNNEFFMYFKEIIEEYSLKNQDVNIKEIVFDSVVKSCQTICTEGDSSTSKLRDYGNKCLNLCDMNREKYKIFHSLGGDCSNSIDSNEGNNEERYNGIVNNIKSKKIWLGISEDSFIDIDSNILIDENNPDINQGNVLNKAVEEFKQKTSEEQQRIFSEMQKQFNDLRTDDFNVEYKINQTINISDYYSECGGWHLETGINVITYGRDYGIVYNSLDKFERKIKSFLGRLKECPNVNFITKNYLIVEYNSTTKIWDLNLSAQIFNSDDLNNLEKEIKRVIELLNLYNYKSLRN